MRRRAAHLGCLVASLLLVQAAAAALWVDGSSAAMPVSSAALAPPTAPSATPGACVIAVSDRITVSWTASASTWATGYEVARAVTSGGPFTVVGSTTAPTVSFSDGPLAFASTFFYKVRATKGSWRSPYTAVVSRTTRSAVCL